MHADNLKMKYVSTSIGAVVSLEWAVSAHFIALPCIAPAPRRTAQESLFIRAKLASRLSPFTPDVIDEVKRVLESCEEIAEAEVTMNG